MENKIRLVWDFRGADSFKTAEHQLIHLVEFMIKEDISYTDSHQNRLMTLLYLLNYY